MQALSLDLFGTLNIDFSVACYLKDTVQYLLTLHVILYQVKMLMFYSVQTTSLTFKFVGKE
jgi:hypothetical protein